MYDEQVLGEAYVVTLENTCKNLFADKILLTTKLNQAEKMYTTLQEQYNEMQGLFESEMKISNLLGREIETLRKEIEILRTREAQVKQEVQQAFYNQRDLGDETGA